MTRCYEYYCMIERDATRCDKKALSKYFIQRYQTAMKARGVHFDYSEVDKARFLALQKEIGSERAFLYNRKEYDENSVVLTKEDIFKIESELNVLHGDFRERGKAIPDNSINLILTDPPYGAEYLELWLALSELANRVLLPGAFLISYSGQLYLPYILSALRENLEYYWILALRQKERNLITARNVFSIWKPILIFYKSPLKLNIEYLVDVIEGQGAQKTNHKWQQAESEIYPLIEYFCPQNGVILDPMAGSGTTLAAAKKLNRQFIGIELEQKNLPIIEERLKNVKDT